VADVSIVVSCRVKALKRLSVTKEDVKDVQKSKAKFRSEKRQYERSRQSCPHSRVLVLVDKSNVSSSVGA